MPRPAMPGRPSNRGPGDPRGPTLEPEPGARAVAGMSVARTAGFGREAARRMSARRRSVHGAPTGARRAVARCVRSGVAEAGSAGQPSGISSGRRAPAQAGGPSAPTVWGALVERRGSRRAASGSGITSSSIASRLWSRRGGAAPSPERERLALGSWAARTGRLHTQRQMGMVGARGVETAITDLSVHSRRLSCAVIGADRWRARAG
jgi:hypothetical protein